MGARFNAPPGWPEPPRWWTPGPGWTPDPSWPEPPPGWCFWVDDEVPPELSRPAAGTGVRPGGDVATQVAGWAALALVAAATVWALVVGSPGTALVLLGLAGGALGLAALVLGRVRWARVRSRPVALGLLLAAVVALGTGLDLQQGGPGAGSTVVVQVPEAPFTEQPAPSLPAPDPPAPDPPAPDLPAPDPPTPAPSAATGDDLPGSPSPAPLPPPP
ncbi:hypothetical protein [Pseudokineococcus sp. 1T1Z-3]|uniref:hypothetical protein n=1 Tax=Pseudokineococcus sp. 1T1Z-3 TaxID=3132745 RepID=UPI0030A23B79